MAPVVAGALIEGVRTLLDRFLPNPAERAAAELELARMAQAGQLAQIEVNKAEAASPSLLVAGWRPAAGWVCVAALGVQFVVGPLGVWVSHLTGHPIPPPPALDNVLWELLAALLGLGTLRSLDKRAGKA